MWRAGQTPAKRFRRSSEDCKFLRRPEDDEAKFKLRKPWSGRKVALLGSGLTSPQRCKKLAVQLSDSDGGRTKKLLRIICLLFGLNKA